MESKKMKIRKGDTVKILAGKYKGKEGKVLKAIPAKSKIIVEGINFKVKHMKPTQKNPQGGILEKEAPMHVSNAMLVCKKCGAATRIAMKVLEDGTKERICKKCGEIIPKVID